MPAQSPEEQAFSKAWQGLLLLALFEGNRSEDVPHAIGSVVAAQGFFQILAGPGGVPLLEQGRSPARDTPPRKGSSRMAFVRSSKASSGVPELAQGQPAADQRLWVIGLDFQCFVKVFQRFFRVGTRLAFPKDMCFCEKLFGLRVMLARHARGVGGLRGHLFRLQQRTAWQREDGQQGQPSRNRPGIGQD